MIQNKTAADRHVEGNLQGEEIAMQVGDMAHLMNVVTDLYSNRERACVREYSTNAIDAHVEAGVVAPIEVTTPTLLSPFLTIRDFGIGLSLEDIRTIYSQYGISTKRGTNAQNGMLGLGCKSALSYADQFTVTSVKDGVRIQVVVSRNTTGASMKVVDTSDTDEPNGTTVTIPAKYGNTIEDEAKDFFKYWKPGTVMLNGKEPQFMPDAQWVVQDEIALVKTNDWRAEQNFVVMGGVAYPAPNMQTGMGSGTGVVAFVPIGAVDFAPSRESLMDTDTTKATLDGVVTKFKNALQQSIRDDIAAAATPREAIERRMAWTGKVPHGMVPVDVKFKGKVVPENQKVPAGTIYTPFHGRKLNSHSVMTDHMPINTVLGSIWVHGWELAGFTPTTRKKLWQYCEEKNLGQPGLILSKDKPDMEWIEGVPLVQWADIKAIKLPRNAVNRSTGRIAGSYDIYEDGTFNEGVPGDDIDTTNPVFWMNGSWYEGQQAAKYLASSYPGSTLVMLRRGREDKFQRLFPKAKMATKVIRDDYEKYTKGLSQTTVDALSVQGSGTYQGYEKIDPKYVDDPMFGQIAKLVRRDLTRVRERLAAWQKLGYYYTTGSSGPDLPDARERYPLLFDRYGGLRVAKMDHVYRYINSEYAHLVTTGQVDNAGK